jgi:hypothetical protein
MSSFGDIKKSYYGYDHTYESDDECNLSLSEDSMNSEDSDKSNYKNITSEGSVDSNEQDSLLKHVNLIKDKNHKLYRLHQQSMELKQSIRATNLQRRILHRKKNLYQKSLEDHCTVDKVDFDGSDDTSHNNKALKKSFTGIKIIKDFNHAIVDVEDELNKQMLSQKDRLKKRLVNRRLAKEVEASSEEEEDVDDDDDNNIILKDILKYYTSSDSDVDQNIDDGVNDDSDDDEFTVKVIKHKFKKGHKNRVNFNGRKKKVNRTTKAKQKRAKRKGKTRKKKWELKMKEKEPLQCWTVNTISSTNPLY